MTMDYSTDDTNGKPISRDVTLTDILISKGVQELNLISAIVALGEGERLFRIVLLANLLIKSHALNNMMWDMMNQPPRTSRSSFRTTSITPTLERRIPPEMISYTSTSPVMTPCSVPSATPWCSPWPPPRRLPRKLTSVPLH